MPLSHLSCLQNIWINFRPERSLVFYKYVTIIFALSSLFSSAFADTETNFQRALTELRKDPSDPAVSIAFVEAAVASGNTRIAIARLESLIAQNPDLSNLKFELGMLYRQFGSPQLAQKLITEAMADPSFPPIYRARAERELAEAVDAQRGWSVETELALSLRAETNANAGPGDARVQFVTNGLEVGALLNRDDTEQSDISVVGTIGTTFRVDLGTQAGDQLIGTLYYYGTRYQSEKDLDLDFFSGEIGPEVNLERRLGAAVKIRPYAAAAHIREDGRPFLSEYGGGIDLVFKPTSRLTAQARVDARVTDFNRGPSAPLNDQRDGVLTRFVPQVRYLVQPNLSVGARVEVGRNTADKGFESYWQAGSALQMIYAYSDPLGLAGIPWSSTLGAGYRHRQHDRPDPSIDLDDKQRDHRFDVSLETEAPVNQTASGFVRGGYVANSSNYAIDDFENFFLSGGLRLRF